jgi:hypothetical protein
MWRALLLGLIVVAVAPLGAEAGRGVVPLKLNADGIGSVPFGVSQSRAVASLKTLLGRPTSEGVNTGCGDRFVEVAGGISSLSSAAACSRAIGLSRVAGR